MPDRRSEKSRPVPWHVPVAVEDIAEDGQHFALAADAADHPHVVSESTSATRSNKCMTQNAGPVGLTDGALSDAAEVAFTVS